MLNIKKKIETIFRKIILSSIPELYDYLKNKRSFEQSIIRLQNNHHDVVFGGNNIIYPPSQIHHCSIGSYSYIARNATISYTTIGKFCSIGPNLVCGWGIHPTDGISTHPMFYSILKQNGMTLSTINKIKERKQITIGNDVFIGANVTILDGVTICDGAVIGAGAVVSKDIPPYAVAIGCPIKILRYRFDEDTRQKFLKIKWWDFDDEQLKEVEEKLFDIVGFVDAHYK